MYSFRDSLSLRRNNHTSTALHSLTTCIFVLMLTLLVACSEDPDESALPSAGQTMSDDQGGAEVGEMAAGEMDVGGMSAGEMSAGEMSAGDRAGGESGGGDEVAGEVVAGEPLMGGESSSGVEVEAGEMIAGGTEVDPNRPPEGQDLDQDGLDDRWEWSAGDASRLDWNRADTDGDGILDGDEDEDGDGLTASEEWVVESYRRLLTSEDQAPARIVDGAELNPLRPDLIVELDEMEGRLSEVATRNLVQSMVAASYTYPTPFLRSGRSCQTSH